MVPLIRMSQWTMQFLIQVCFSSTLPHPSGFTAVSRRRDCIRLLPWTLTCDLDLQTWLIYGQGEPSSQIFRSRVISIDLQDTHGGPTAVPWPPAIRSISHIPMCLAPVRWTESTSVSREPSACTFSGHVGDTGRGSREGRAPWELVPDGRTWVGD